jgi:biopolymer transport protein TolR
MPKVMSSTPAPGGRSGRGRRVTPTLAEINVVPLVDVMLVLLIIFMVAAPMLQKGVELNLPVASRSQSMASEQDLYVSVPLAYREDRRVYLGEEAVRVDVLSERVRQLMANRSDRQVFLRLDGKLEVQDQMDIFDRLKAGGIDKIGIVSRLPGEQ